MLKGENGLAAIRILILGLSHPIKAMVSLAQPEVDNCNIVGLL